MIMTNFRARMQRASARNGRIILAVDHAWDGKDLAVDSVETLHSCLSAVKLNLHLLLPLGAREISRICDAAHSHGMQVIADIKLNDIDSTNQAVATNLWRMGFDAVIANPIMGREGLRKLILSAHERGNGVIALCHMSSPDASSSYEIELQNGSRLYRVFLDWAISEGADGIVVGATFPGMVRYCKERAGRSLEIYSPGVGAQGGSAADTISAGTDYIIVGRTILGSTDPLKAAMELKVQSAAPDDAIHG